MCLLFLSTLQHLVEFMMNSMMVFWQSLTKANNLQSMLFSAPYCRVMTNSHSVLLFSFTPLFKQHYSRIIGLCLGSLWKPFFLIFIFFSYRANISSLHASHESYDCKASTSSISTVAIVYFGSHDHFRALWDLLKHLFQGELCACKTLLYGVRMDLQYQNVQNIFGKSAGVLILSNNYGLNNFIY